MNKLHARKTTLDGIFFASALEAKRYSQLKLLLMNGDIADLELQPKYPLVITSLKTGEQKQVARYSADFQYYDRTKGAQVVEDVKGVMTEAAALRIKIVQALYDIEIVLVRKEDI
jgi:hypothetical protein